MSNEVRVDIVSQVKGDIQGQINKARTSLDTLKKTTDTWAQSNTKASAEANKAAQALQKQGTASTQTASKMKQVSTTTTQTGTAMGTAASKVKNLGSTFSSMASGLATSALAITNLARSYRDLEDTQIAVQRTQLKLSKAHEAVTKAEQKLRDLRHNDEATSEDIAAAELDLAQAREMVEVATLNAGEAQEAQSDAYQDFYLSIIPASLGIIGSLGSALAVMKSNSSGAAGGFSQLSAGAKVMTVAMKAIPLVAIASALLAIRTNAFGFRDALNELGARIGAFLPAVVPLLNWIKDLATALGLTGKALDMKAAWQLFTDGFKTAVNNLMTFDWATALQTFINNAILWIQNKNNWILLGEAIIKAFEDAIEWTRDNVEPWLKKLVEKVVDWAKEKSNWEKVGKAIMDAFKEAVKWVKENVWPIFAPFVEQAVAWATDAGTWTGVASSIQTGIKTALDAVDWAGVWQAFQDALWAGGEWVNTAVTQIAEAIKGFITIENAKDWWAGFHGAISEGLDIIRSGLSVIGGDITKEIKSRAIAEVWWKGFQDAFKETAAWVGTGIIKIGQEVAKEIISKGPGWWEGFRVGLAKDVAWVATQVAKVGEAIKKWFVDNANALGTAIWNAIAGGITSAIGGLGGILNLIPGIGSAHATTEDDKKGVSLEEAHKQMGTTPGGTAPTGMTVEQVGALQKAWSSFSTSFATYKNSITTNLTNMQTAFSGFSTSMSTYITGIQTKWSAFSTSFATYKTSITTNALAIQTAFSTLSTSIATYTTSIGTHMTVITTGVGVMATTVKGQLTALTTSFTGLDTSIGTALTALNTKIGLFVTNLKAQFAGISVTLTAAATEFNTMNTSIGTALTAINTKIGLFVTNTKTQFTAVATSMKGVQTASSTLSTTVSTHMNSMKTAVTNFASAFSSAMKKVQSDAKAATSAVKALQSAVNALKSKTITIHVNLSGPGAAYAQHGGSFVRTHAQGGVSGIVNRPTTMGGVHMGEGFKPELVTVTPLTRGTGNHTGPTVSSDAMGGGGTMVNNITVVLDGRVIQRFVEKTALSGVGMQV